MPRNPTGNVYESRERWYARTKIAKDRRPSIPLPTCTTKEQAEARLGVLVDLTARLRTARVPPESIQTLLEGAGAATEGKALDRVRNTIELCARGTRARWLTRPGP